MNTRKQEALRLPTPKCVPNAQGAPYPQDQFPQLHDKPELGDTKEEKGSYFNKKKPYKKIRVYNSP